MGDTDELQGVTVHEMNIICAIATIISFAAGGFVRKETAGSLTLLGALTFLALLAWILRMWAVLRQERDLGIGNFCAVAFFAVLTIGYFVSAAHAS